MRFRRSDLYPLRIPDNRRILLVYGRVRDLNDGAKQQQWRRALATERDISVDGNKRSEIKSP